MLQFSFGDHNCPKRFRKVKEIFQFW